MNENPEGTPNPLNPAMPAEPAQPIQPAEPIISQPVAAPAPAEPVVSQPVISQPVTAPEPQQPVMQPAAQPAMPSEEPAMQPAVKPAKKSRKPLVIVLVTLLIALLVGGAAAAIVILKPFDKAGQGRSDAVPAALAKLFSNELPGNVNMDGTVSVYSSDSLNVSVNFSTQLNTVTTENIASATFNIAMPTGDTFEFNADEIHTKDGDLYLKLGGVSSALENWAKTQTNCMNDETNMSNCIDGQTAVSIAEFVSIFDVIDDEWVYIPQSMFESMDAILPSDNMTTCLVNAAGNLGQYGSNFVSLYQANPFINYSTDNITISSKGGTLYHLIFDTEKLTNFINALSNSGFANELMACAGETAVNVDVTTDDLAEIVNAIPAIYVEIDDQNNFTRVYLSVTSEDGTSSAIADVSFSYPTSAVVIEEPESYISLSDFLAGLLSSFYGADVTE